MSALTVGSLFSGVGGLDLGLERAGMRVRWQCEQDRFCRRVLTRRFPDVDVIYSNVETIDFAEVEGVDVICAGPPCQPISVAGKRRGADDPRWLWPHVFRAARVLRPRFLILENPPGLFTAGFGVVLGALAALGFDAEWDCLPAAAFGAPQLRDRLYLVAWRHPIDGQTRVGYQSQRQEPLFTAPDRERAGVWMAGADRGPRSDDGVPGGLYRQRVEALGNAVVPQVAEHVGRCVIAFAERTGA